MTIDAKTRIAGYRIWPGPDLLPAAALGLAEGLRLAATPAYGLMALFTAVLGESPRDMLCMAMHHASPVGGMVWMYVLMSVFHSAPWLRLIASRVSSARWS
ncbi:MAG TPA: hypothetical protein VMA30_17245 [Xanthobacteraceae bacterium]|nr:hypothetical protein [Xanthobacteraceae bacterium]